MSKGVWALTLMGLLLAGCAGPELRTQPLGPMGWESDSEVLPPVDRRYELPQTLPANTLVNRQPDRLVLELDPQFTERRVPNLRFFIDSNGLPLIEMPTPTDEAFGLTEAALEELGWTVRRVNLRENRIELDASEWLPPLSSQIFFRTPVVYLYLFTLGGGTQVHLEHRNPDEDFPISIQRELLEALYAELS
jgi:hypothetical protein